MWSLLSLSAKPLTTPTWPACAAALVLHQISQKVLGWQVPFLDSYLDPLLGVPVLLGLAQAERRFVTGWLAAHGYPSLRGWRRFTGPEVTVMTLVLAAVFEGLFPWLDQRQTRDWLDVVAAAMGGVIYWLGVNPCE